MAAQTSHTVVTEIKADLDELQSSRALFVAYLRSISLPEDEIHSWELVFSEAVANAIQHGSQPKRGDTVRIEWKNSVDSVLLTVKDKGLGPKAELIEDPQLPQNPLATSGRGLFLIKHFSDNYTYTRGIDGFSITISKFYPELNLPTI